MAISDSKRHPLKLCLIKYELDNHVIKYELDNHVIKYELDNHVFVFENSFFSIVVSL